MADGERPTNYETLLASLDLENDVRRRLLVADASAEHITEVLQKFEGLDVIFQKVPLANPGSSANNAPHIYELPVIPQHGVGLGRLVNILEELCEDGVLRLALGGPISPISLTGSNDDLLRAAGETLVLYHGVKLRIGPLTPIMLVAPTRPADVEKSYVFDALNSVVRLKMMIEPTKPGTGYSFADDIELSEELSPLRPMIDKALVAVPFAGNRLTDYKVSLIYANVEKRRSTVGVIDIDALALVVKRAAIRALFDCLETAGCRRLEPMLHVEVKVPTRNSGKLLDDLLSRRAKVMEDSAHRGTRLIVAEVPAATMIGFKSVLSSMTEGLGSYTGRFSSYGLARWLRFDGQMGNPNIERRQLDEKEGRLEEERALEEEKRLEEEKKLHNI